MQRQKIAVYTNLEIELSEVLRIAEDTEWVEATVGGRFVGMDDTLIKLEPSIRDASLKKLKVLQEAIFPDLKNYVEDYAQNNLVMDTFALVKYTEGQFFAEHSDGVANFGRALSIVIYLNDDYEGGELYFRNQNLTMKPVAKSMVMFPSTDEFLHEAKPVISGTKYAIVSFWHQQPNMEN